ncbi:G-type lectin S-receptor-like serine/threonine-protein kinase At5g35370 isoform X3 [Rosa chinensis]|uniref:G-type lectin S-receptor-like serine/threonine-protein kinase At5g35370 isoform X3 n=1 Tax=Rosa chinensis TaxID=74649 RepID=UPI001AD8AD47|nr:G-type lectin S-receptor-like serine/threonine-protein kinase At5g35370 isoform X3 [Rosa chinensis]
MGSFLFIPAVFLFFVAVSGISFTEFIYPPFSASHYQFIDNAGTFLSSRNGTFRAAMFNPDAQSNFYLSIIHEVSNTVIWSANRNAAISSSGEMNLTVKGLSISDADGNPVWSTPALKSSVYALLLNEVGNLILLDQFNGSLWESFHYPTDTIVIGQELSVGSILASSSGATNFSTGDYKLALSSSDVILQWHGQTYWKLSMDTRAYKNSNYVAEYMAINRTGLQLLGLNGTMVVIQVLLTPSDFQIAQLDPSGKFIVKSFSGSQWNQEFVGPIDGCRIPFFCGRIGLCTGSASTNPTCSSCPSTFHVSSQDNGGCLPNSPYSPPLPCNSTNNGSQLNSSAVSYIKLGNALGFLLHGRRRRAKEKEIKLGSFDSRSSGDMDGFYIPGLPKRFDFEELEVATDNFKTLIGSGGFGAVYKGILRDKTVVAVKKITNVGVQGKKDFCAEIAVIGNVHHANLVKLKGFCAQGRRRLLVYEYMNRGSLDRTLFGSGPVIEWQERLDIALGTARGLAYLHGGCDQKIIHCDVKPENILLQDHFQAKLSDFGLSKLLSPEQSSLFTTMRGTRGYLAPEWLTNSAISEKTDVYSFGMVLLELVSGRKNTLRLQSHNLNDSSSGGGQSSSSSGSGPVYFPLFALEMHEQGRYLELVDLRLEGRVTSEEVEKFVRVALCCVQEEPALRPNMNTVVGMLEGGIPLSQPNFDSLNFLRFIGRRFTEASMIEEGTERNDRVLYQESNSFPTRTTIGSHTCFSYVSSQEVSGPR